MPTRLSEVLGTTREALEKKGVYDSMVDYDSRLHIDPALLIKCKTPEFKGAVGKVTAYFNNLLRLLRLSRNEDDVLWRTALKRLTFGEGLNTGLGYSEKGTAGSGIGPEIAERIITTVKQIIDAGTIDPTIFELVPVFEDRIGPDRISDMISKILEEEFHAFTARVAKEINVSIPTDVKGNQIVFVPKDIISDLPVAEEWDDISIAAEYNERVRESLNTLVGKTWKKVAAETTKKELKELILKSPELLQELLKLYKKRVGKEYDFVLDHMGIMLWDIVGPEAAGDNPIDLSHFTTVTPENVLDVVIEICNQYQKLIENNGLVEHLYDSNGDRRPERFPQLLFFAIADSYCVANKLDLNREINAGSGALDFKVSSGLAKVTVEIKYTSNPKLVEGFEKQLPVYNRAESVQAKHSIYLVLRVNENNDHKIGVIFKTIEEKQSKGEQSPNCIVIDAIKKPSASKR